MWMTSTCKSASAHKSDVYIIWYHVPAGFAHADDMKISLVVCCLKPLSWCLLYIAGTGGGIMCVRWLLEVCVCVSELRCSQSQLWEQMGLNVKIINSINKLFCYFHCFFPPCFGSRDRAVWREFHEIISINDPLRPITANIWLLAF